MNANTNMYISGKKLVAIEQGFLIDVESLTNRVSVCAMMAQCASANAEALNQIFIRSGPVFIEAIRFTPNLCSNFNFSQKYSVG